MRGAGGQVPKGVRATSLAMSGNYAVLVRASDGGLQGWGDSRRPAPPAGAFVSIACGSSSCCALRASRTVSCFGSNYVGESTPPSGVTLSMLSMARYAAVGLRADGTLVCWGDTSGGRCAPAFSGGSYTAVATGYDATCAVAAGTAVVSCFGSTSVSWLPDASFMTLGASELVAGGFRTCVIANGALAGRGLCSGYGFDGSALLPRTVAFSRIGVGAVVTCGINAADSTILCAGSYGDGVIYPPAGTFFSIAVGTSHACARNRARGCCARSFYAFAPCAGALTTATQKKPICWGSGQGAQGAPAAGSYAAVAVGDLHSCALKVDGSIFCWGSNAFGQVTPAPPGPGHMSIACGTSQSCAVREL